ncbi:OstA-like protein [Persicitalea sp.]|uniref:OstA-like protein n=1 Tax=Persicitalea sp. TaxID=3100273 RepID=UPI00359430ED
MPTRSNLFKRVRVYPIEEAMKNSLLVLFLLLSTWAAGQVRPPGSLNAAAGQEDVVELLPGSDSLRITTENGVEIRRVVNNVRFKHKGSILYCDLAIQNVASNLIQAYGHVKVVQGDTITVTGDTLLYYGDTRFAIVSGKKAVLFDKKRTLTSKRLEYDMANGLAYYRLPGRTVDSANVLTSKEGIYNTRSKVFDYYGDVKLVNEKYVLTTDTLIYNSNTKWSYFNGPTKIVNKDGTLLAKRGQYNTETEESSFSTRTMVENESYTLTGDSLFYDSQKQLGFAKGNVEILAKEDKTLLTGDVGVYRGTEGFSKVFGHALVKSVVSEDTLYIRADTLYSIQNKVDSTRKLIGDRNVYIFKSDFQGRCDSVLYNTADSTVFFFREPILWGDNYQMEADSISAFLVNNKIDRMLLRSNSFVISEDTLVSQFNQVKGRTINAYFNEESNLKRVFVDGNGQSAYYAMDEDEKLIGLNRVECGKMNLQFVANRVNRIAFLGQPVGSLIPPQNIKGPERQLEGFNWRISEKPTLKQTIWAETTVEKNEVEPPKTVDTARLPKNLKQ